LQKFHFLFIRINIVFNQWGPQDFQGLQFQYSLNHVVKCHLCQRSNKVWPNQMTGKKTEIYLIFSFKAFKSNENDLYLLLEAPLPYNFWFSIWMKDKKILMGFIFYIQFIPWKKNVIKDFWGIIFSIQQGFSKVQKKIILFQSSFSLFLWKVFLFCAQGRFS